MAAQILTENLGLPKERRYEVMRILWGESPEEDKEPSFEDSMRTAVDRMEANAERAANRLGLPPEKQDELVSVLYGESGKEVRDLYRTMHPKEQKPQTSFST